MSDETNSPMTDSFHIFRILPNLITITSMCFGLMSIKFAFLGKWELACSMIPIAAICDSLDGRLARMLKSTSELGAQLDSFSDFLSFGIAPALLLHFWTGSSTKSEWIAVMIYAVCVAIRLARFNVDISEPDPFWKKYFFTGVPAPMGAMLALTPLFFSLYQSDLLGEFPVIPNKSFTLIFECFVAFLMVSRLPTLSMKHLYVKKKNYYFVVLFLSLAIVNLFLNPWITLLVINAFYALFMIPAGIAYYLYLARKDAKDNTDSKED